MTGRVEGKVTFITGATLDKTSETDWTAMIDIILGGVWKTVKAGVPHILAGGRGGSIILTSSVGGLKAYPHTGHYVAAKHGVVGLMRTFAVELGAQNIRGQLRAPDQREHPIVHERRHHRGMDDGRPRRSPSRGRGRRCRGRAAAHVVLVPTSRRHPSGRRLSMIFS
jgi:NAD(P)-dependent dehydrogenase (short-subunit alcohol dehydrogenase family)